MGSAVLCRLSYFMEINCSYVTDRVVFSVCRSLPLFFFFLVFFFRARMKSLCPSFSINHSCHCLMTKCSFAP